MGRAEVGTPKYIANQMKAKGLQRLRWYCQVCEKQCRDENGFRCHTQSESHVRQMLIVGENPQKKIKEFSDQFRRDFVSLLKSSHGEKKINVNKFYQEYISDRNHVHMNSTRWVSLTEFAKFLSESGVCKIEADPDREGSLMIAYVDNSPEAMKRRDAARKRDKDESEDFEYEQKLLQQQVKKAKKQSADSDESKSSGEEPKELQREGAAPIKLALNFAKKPIAKPIARPKPIKLR
ncbi:domain of Kin17 curved DNA-binding protein-domain-containing protein [Lipomyces arxii]|uniref:domain of Kin17 curved DNA-binding protein-domain-containing protein n=1 Tax=Lipomyces arxii TaxID=56418 RepID=UPI0034CF8A1F